MSSTLVITFFIAGTILLLLFAGFLVAFVVKRTEKENTYKLETQRILYDHQSEILKTRIEVQEYAMNNISKEIHDNLGQLLGLAQMTLKASMRTFADAKQEDMLKQVKELLDKALLDTRNISHSLNSDIIKKMGLVALLKNELEYINLANQLNSAFEVKGEVFPLGPERELLIYRIAQEAIHNAIKYSQASKISVTLLYDDILKTFKLIIADDGVGFNKDAINLSEGMGLSNMQRRAVLLGGELDIQTAISKGCTITLTIKNGGTIND